MDDSLEDDQIIFSVSTKNKLVFIELLEILFGPTRILIYESKRFIYRARIGSVFLISNVSYSIVLLM